MIPDSYRLNKLRAHDRALATIYDPDRDETRVVNDNVPDQDSQSACKRLRLSAE